jgi:hypothetical protein
MKEMLKCSIAFILGFLIYRLIIKKEYLIVGGQVATPTPNLNEILTRIRNGIPNPQSIDNDAANDSIITIKSSTCTRP